MQHASPSSGANAASAVERATALSILFTSDTHGCLTPVDYATGGAGAACVADFSGELARMRAAGPSLFLDGGDALQGTPLLRYWLSGPAATDEAENPVAAVFGELGLDAFTLGNHDFNYGRDVLAAHLRAMERAGAVCVCANVHDARGELAIRPHTIVERGGLRVGICGIVTDYVNVWEAAEHLSDLTISDALEAAREQAAVLRASCDVTICLYHGGFEEDLASGRVLSDSKENRACAIARELDFDILLTGHQHMAIPEVRFGSTLAAQPPANAFAAVRVDVRGDRVEANGAGQFRSTSRLVKPQASGRTGQGEAAIARVDALDRACAVWLNESVGTLGTAIPAQSKLEVALRGDALADLINEAQLLASGALVSCTSLSNDEVGLPREVTRRDVCAAYRFMNTLMVIEVTPIQLKEALERCASYLELDEQGAPRVARMFLEPKIEHYNYDFYRGISYTANLARPVGERIVQLTCADGSPLPDRFSLALNDYRASGTGGYEVFAACKLLNTIPVSVPVLLENYIAAHPGETVTPRGAARWTF